MKLSIFLQFEHEVQTHLCLLNLSLYLGVVVVVVVFYLLLVSGLMNKHHRALLDLLLR